MPYFTEAYICFLTLVFGFIYLSSIVLRKNKPLAWMPAGFFVLLMAAFLCVLMVICLAYKAFDAKE
jgi:hypothetical protein